MTNPSTDGHRHREGAVAARSSCDATAERLRGTGDVRQAAVVDGVRWRCSTGNESRALNESFGRPNVLSDVRSVRGPLIGLDSRASRLVRRLL
jgi:hypothetical protein